MSRKWLIAFMVIAMGIFTASVARADLGDFVFNITQTLPQNYGHTAGTMLNPEGRGDVLIFPYYDVRQIDGKAQDFYFAIVNGEGECESPTVECHMGMSAKLHFREWDKGEEVLTFDIWLSRGDVWVGMLTRNATNGITRIISPDWVIVGFTSSTFTVNTALASGFDFFTTYVPGGSSNQHPAPSGWTAADMTNLGYFEVIGEERTFDRLSNGIVTRLTGDRDAPNNLMGYGFIVRVTDGVSFAYNAKAIANFSRSQGSLFISPGSIFPTLMNCEDTLDELEFQLSKQEVLADYSIQDALGGKFSLILTFPTKHFHFCGRPSYTLKGDVTAPCDSTFPLGSPWTATDANASERINVNMFDRNENRLVPPPGSPLGLPWGVNAMGFYKGTPPAVPASGIRNNLAFSTGTFDAGYITIGFPNTGYVTPGNPKITNLLDFDVVLSGYGGLPALGLSLQEFTNFNVGGFFGDIRDVFYKVKWYP